MVESSSGLNNFLKINKGGEPRAETVLRSRTGYNNNRNLRLAI